MSDEMYTPVSFSLFPWMEYALQEYGQREVSGSRSNPRIKAYLQSVGVSSGDETHWCSGFVNWCMEEANILGTGRANARSWLAWGDSCLAGPSYGAVAVLWRGSRNGWRGHVAFYVGREGANLWLLGGNQDDAVNIRRYPARRLLGYRWPAGYTPPAI